MGGRLNVQLAQATNGAGAAQRIFLRLTERFLMRLWKRDALAFFGGVSKTAEAMGISDAAVRNWDRLLSRKLSSQVIGFACVAKGIDAAKDAFPKWFIPKDTAA